MDYFTPNIKQDQPLADVAEEPLSPLDSPVEVVELQELSGETKKRQQEEDETPTEPPGVASVVREEHQPPAAKARALPLLLAPPANQPRTQVFYTVDPPCRSSLPPPSSSPPFPALPPSPPRAGEPSRTRRNAAFKPPGPLSRAQLPQENPKKLLPRALLTQVRRCSSHETACAHLALLADSFSDPNVVPVGLDFLFSVNLKSLVLAPDFWAGTPVRVLLSLWFYAPPRPSARPSHLIKCYPVDPALALALETAYLEIKPWESSYEAELQSALRVGVSAEAKLRVPLIREAGQGLECIFVDSDVARVYSTGIVGTVGKSFLSSGRAHGGGQVVLRGWDAVRAWKKKKAAVAGERPDTPTKGDTSASETDEGEASPAPRSRTTSSSSPVKPSQAPPGFFSALKSKMGVAAAAVEEASEAKLAKQDGNDTQEAMEGPRNRKDGESEVEGDAEKVGEVDELVLVIHGIGQKVRSLKGHVAAGLELMRCLFAQLAGTYKSLSFVHAVNDLRTNCTTLSTSSAIAPLIHSKRAQFIPVQWRTDLEFEDEVDGADQEDESLGNRFNLEECVVSLLRVRKAHEVGSQHRDQGQRAFDSPGRQRARSRRSFLPLLAQGEDDSRRRRTRSSSYLFAPRLTLLSSPAEGRQSHLPPFLSSQPWLQRSRLHHRSLPRLSSGSRYPFDSADVRQAVGGDESQGEDVGEAVCFRYARADSRWVSCESLA